MKMNFFSKATFCALLVGSALFLSSCDKEDDVNNNNRNYTVSGSGSGTQVVPSVTTTATSSLTGTYNSGTNVLNYNISWTGLVATASAVKFYGPAATGVNASGSSQFDAAITTPGITGTASGSVTLSESQETDLLAGKWYYTISNATYATGEVRGQITTVVQ